MEYTWSFWIKINGILTNTTNKKYNHVFSKGVSAKTKTWGNTGQVIDGNNGPGVYLSSDANGTNSTGKLTVIMDTVNNGQSETIEIDNIPYNKWIHVAIRLQNKILDVYINGTLKKRVSFSNVPKQNYGDIWVSQNGGFDGSISDFRYFDRALNAFQLSNITSAGPNMKSVADVVDTSSDYLSNKWF